MKIVYHVPMWGAHSKVQGRRVTSTSPAAFTCAELIGSIAPDDVVDVPDEVGKKILADYPANFRAATTKDGEARTVRARPARKEK